MQHENWDKHTFPASFSDNTLVFNNPEVYTSQKQTITFKFIFSDILNTNETVKCMIEHEKLIIFLIHPKKSTNSICL